MSCFEYDYIDYVRENMIPDAHKMHYGSYMSFDDKPISPGCIACKTGGWLCAFVGTKCNCTCPHCPNPAVVNHEEDISTTGRYGKIDIGDMITILEKPYYKGVGISGGEPLLYMDTLVDWITKIKSKFPKLYVWNYTNGVFATEDNLKRLADAGVDEIRFDLAADNYSQQTLDNLYTATKLIPSVGIEVPVMAEQYQDLIKVVDFADTIGVKYLNLHDLFINDTIFKNGTGGYMRFFDKISKAQRDILNSSTLIYKVFRHIKDNNLNIVPNDCNLINMQMQAFSFSYQEFVDNSISGISFDEYLNMMFETQSEDDLLIEKL